MSYFLRKAFYKSRLKLTPKGRSKIRLGFGKGLWWTHEVSDLRYLCGDYEDALAKWLKSKSEAGASFIDVGANAGYFCLIAARNRKNKNQRIIAVEPARLNVELIKKHAAWNGFDDIEVLPFAASDKNRVVTFSASENMAANTYVASSSLHKNSPKVDVEARTLDAICEQTGVTDFVIKIDVEGAELDVLKGAEKILTTLHPELILATHECHVAGIEQACIDFLMEKGYTCEEVEDEKFIEGQRDYLCRYTG